MTDGAAMSARIGIFVLAIVGYALLAHLFSTQTHISPWLLPLAVAPLALTLALRPQLRKWSALIIVLAIALALAPQWLMHSAPHLAWLYFVQDSALNIGLGLLFGFSLRRGEIPLCSRIAMSMQSQPSSQLLRYTRAVTWAWTLFFSCMVVVSTLLFVWSDHTTWSIFANLLYWPLLIAMFALEYGVRLLRLPRAERAGFFATINAFSHFYGRRDKHIVTTNE